MTPTDPFSQQHRANARADEKKTERQKATEETVARNARLTAKATKPKFDKPYIWTGHIWNQ